MMTIEEACEIMHDAYEEAAVTAGWETQERSRKPWAEVPEANKETMRAAVRALLEALAAER
jgi:cytochrome bd-type quinol oxidase subunit 1